MTNNVTNVKMKTKVTEGNLDFILSLGSITGFVNEPKYISMKKIILLPFVLLCCFSSFAQSSGENLFDNNTLHEIRIYFEEDDFWDILTENYQVGSYSGEVDYLQTTQIIIDGNTLDTVGVRQKGFSSHFASNEFKKSIKIDFNEFVSGQEYDGLRKINLANGVGDPSFQRDMLCYDMMRTAGIAAPRTAHTTLYLNDQYWGIYVLIEQVDKTFVSENFDDDNGDLFKNMGWSALEYLGTNPTSYKEFFELKTNKTEDNWSDFIELCDVINNTSIFNFPDAIQKVFDVDEYLRVLAIDVLTNNWDSYIEHGRNWYLYHEPEDGLFHWVPWDYNLSMGGNFDTAGSPIALDTICPLIPEFSASYIDDTLFLVDESTDAVTWSWTLGDGNISVDQNPIHIYDSISIYNVCLTITNTFDDSLCSKTTCQNIDMTYSVADCSTIQNGSCPYPADDPVVQEVMAVDPFCCDNDWDGICQMIYDDISNGGGPGTTGGPPIFSFPLIINNPDRVLIDRLMDVSDFRQQYLEHVCEIMDNNFTAERLYPMVDAAAALVREDIYSDPYYLFTSNYFEYDVGFGGLANGASIPQIKVFIDERIPQIWDDLDDLNYTCDSWTTTVEWHDVVINEFVASNDSTSTITDGDGEFEDWIELYNNSDQEINLFGFYLSDNADNPRKWRFPTDASIGANEFLIVWADKNESEEGIHAGFELAKDGEHIVLTHQDGTIIDSISYDEQVTNVPSARVPNGTGDFVNQTETFDASNDIVISVVDPDQLGFNVYPNPANTFVQVTFDETMSSSASLRIRNALGQTISEIKLNNSRTHNFAVDKLSTGIYFMEVFDVSTTSTKKFVISR